MATSTPESLHPTTDADGRANDAPAGFGWLARRITGWTSNLVATAVILVAGLAVGRQLMEWWHVAAVPTPGDSAVAPLDANDFASDFDAASSFEFADTPQTIRRETIRGDKRAAARALADRCQTIAAQAKAPSVAIASAESRLLDRLHGVAPSHEGPGGFQLFEFDDALPMTVAVRTLDAAATSALPEVVRDGDAPKRRVIVWGLAFPAQPDSWTLFIIQPAGDSGGPSHVATPQVALPPGSTRVMAIRDESAGSVTAFKGPGPADVWMRFFRGSLARQGWATIEDWHAAGGLWHARYGATVRGSPSSLLVQISAEGPDRLLGLVHLTVRRADSTATD